MRRIRCPRCRKVVEIREPDPDKPAVCPSCSARIRISAPAASAKPPAGGASASGREGSPGALKLSAVRLRCAKCSHVFPGPAKPTAVVSCPRCGGRIRPKLPGAAESTGPKPTTDSGKNASAAGSPQAAAEPPRRFSQKPADPGHKPARARPTKFRSGLNPMSDSFLDKMEDLNRSAAGIEMIAPKPSEGGIAGLFGMGGSSRGKPRRSQGENLPPLVWLIGGGVLLVMAGIGAVASLKWLLGF